MTPDALLASMQRVLRAVAPEADAARMLTRLERRLQSGAAWEEADRESLAELLELVEVAYPDGAERTRLADALELAHKEERTGDAGVLCVREQPRRWSRWLAAGVRHHDDPWNEHRDATTGYIAVRRGWGEPELLVTRRLAPWATGLGALYVPETTRLFAMARDRVHVFDLDRPEAPPREHELLLVAGMSRHGDRVVIQDETDVVALTLAGDVAWSVFADPPYVATVEGDVLVIREELMGSVPRRHRLSDGTPA